MGVSEYKVIVSVHGDNDNRTVEINDRVEINHREGQVRQMANLFYRAMLANGFSPAATGEAMGQVAQAAGYGVVGQQSDLDLFNFKYEEE